MEVKRIQKSGGSYTITIPHRYMKYFGMKKGDYVRMRIADGKIQISPDYKAAAAGISEEDTHDIYNGKVKI